MALETLSREHVIAGVSPRGVYDVVTDYACYPRIFPDFTGARVVTTTGAVQRVEFRAKVVLEVRYTLDITHDPERLTTQWVFVEGHVVADSVGGWAFFVEGDGTRIKYHAGMAIKAPLPRVMINKITNALMGQSIPNMFRAVEREALARRNYAQK